MRKTMRKAGAIALSATVTLGSLAACAKSEQNPTSAASTQGTTPKTTVTPKTTAVLETAAAPETTAALETTAPLETTTVPEGTTEAPKPENDTQKAFSEFEQDIIEYIINGHYYYAELYFKDPAEYGLAADQLTDHSIVSYKDPEGTVKQKAERAKALLERSDLIDRTELNDRQKLAYDKFRYYLETNLRKQEVPLLSSPLNTSDCMVALLPTDLFLFPFDGENDLAGYQKVLETVPGALADEIEYIKYQKEKLGYEPSDDMISEAIYNAQNLAVEDSPLLEGYDVKVEAMDLPADRKAEYIRKNREYVTGPLAEALQKYVEELKQFDTDTNGTKPLCAYEGGAEYYTLMLQSLSGTDMSPQEMFDYIEKDMKKRLTRYFYYTNVKPEIADAYYEGEFTFAYDPLSVDSVTNHFKEVLKEILPLEMLSDYSFAYWPESIRGDGYDIYSITTRIGDTSPATVYRNPEWIGDEYLLEMDASVVREIVGGYLLMDACQNKTLSVAEHLLPGMAYYAGWATYIQDASFQYSGLSKEMAEYRVLYDFPWFEALVLADIGVNAFGWTQEQVSEFLKGISVSTDSAEEMYSLAIQSPAGYLKTIFGEIKTEELIEKYKEKYADDLNVKEMYLKYMSIGATSFDIVEKYFLGE